MELSHIGAVYVKYNGDRTPVYVQVFDVYRKEMFAISRPTGLLSSQTFIDIMDFIRNISNDFTITVCKNNWTKWESRQLAIPFGLS